MKALTRHIIDFQEKDLFFPLRDKVDFAKLILVSSRLLLLNVDTEPYDCHSYLKLVVNKMSRLFFFKENKFFSLSFPFKVLIDGGEVRELRTSTGNIVDNEKISLAISILNNEQFRLKPSPMEYLFEIDEDEQSGLLLLEEIFLSEPAYVRYDVDAERANGYIHPLIHLDINYASYGTYKIGLHNELTETKFENIFNTLTNCSFLNEVK